MLELKPLPIAKFREGIKDHYNDARRGQPVPVSRAHDDGAAFMFDADRFLQVTDAMGFTPEVFERSGQIGMWLPQLDLYSLGAHAVEAEADLLEEVREYYTEYLGDLDTYLAAPNRAGHYIYVVRAYAADVRGRLAEVVLAGSLAPSPVAA